MIGLEPAHIDWSEGLPSSPRYGDVFHSRDGGPGQARAVFIAGNELPQRWRGRRHFTLLETGLGSATNLLATWATWREDPEACEQLTYIACELHPWRAEDLKRLHGQGPWTPLCAALCADWPPPLQGFHTRLLEGGRLRLILLWGDAAAQLAELDASVDAFYLDGFAPDRNPALWQPELLTRLGALAAPGATAATYTVAAAVREALIRAGFDVERCAGYGRKRHALRARHLGAVGTAEAPRHLGPEATWPRSVAVIGAGVAGLSIARRLADQGVRITVHDTAGTIASGASGNPRAVVRPWLTVDDTPGTRFTRAAFGLARQHYASVAEADWQGCGLLQLPRQPRDAERHPAALAALGLPSEWMHLLSREDASAYAAQALPEAAILTPHAGHLSPPGWCHWAARHPLIDLQLGRCPSLDALRHDHTAVVLACGADANAYLPRPLPFSRVRGQLTNLPPGSLMALRCILAREGYVLPLRDGAALVGATYDRHDDPGPTAEGHSTNLRRLSSVLSNPPDLTGVAVGGRVAFRAVLPGRLPAVGAIPGLPGVWLASGYASRGWVWAQLLAEQLSSQLLQRPLPLEHSLAQALLPERFLRAT